APKMFGNVDRRGVPMQSLVATFVVALLTFLMSIFGTQIYMFLVAASGLTGFIAWAGIAAAHYRFRKAYIAQGKSLDDLVYKAKWYPFGPIVALVLCILVIVGQDLESFHTLNWQAIGITYMSVPLFIVLYVGYKIKYHTKVIPLDQVDLTK
ncbi:gamma-aminobutyrate permease, partial [Bifidobacteriaceae bacterium VN002]